MKTRTSRRAAFRLSVAAAAIAAGFVVPTAQAAPLTVGSPLTATPIASFEGTATEVNFILEEPGARVTSPVTGTIVSYRVAVESAPGLFAIRAIRPAGGEFMGVGGSPAVQLNTNGLHTVSASVPIRAGDFIGLDLANDDAAVTEAQPGGSTVFEWGNPGLLANGATEPPANIYDGSELLFNADVVASNTVAVGATQRNKRKGTATLNLTVPNPGSLSASANGAKVSSSTSKAVVAGPVQVRVKATGKKQKNLNRTGKVKVNVTLSYTPTLGDIGTQSVKVKLKKKL
jgi:hypothetical protein